MTCNTLESHLTHEEEQHINYLLELVNLNNLDDKSKPNQPLTLAPLRFSYLGLET